jgi:transposase
MKSKIRKKSLRQRRIFSESVRKGVVKDIETGTCTVVEASLELQVSSVSIYRWIEKYSRYLRKNKIMVVQEKSEAYRTRELEKRIQELEAALGRQSLETTYLHKLIEIASKELSIDIKKKFASQPLLGSKHK